jgi:GT2 family glycosyltransferase
MPPLVSFIVVNWNGEACLEECLNSIQHQTFRDFECIVVENGSSDRSREILRSFPKIIVMENERNLGFGPANNQALARSRGKIIAFVNNDTVLDAGWLEKITEPMLARQQVGMCAGKTLSYFRRELIDNTGHLLYWDGLNRGRGRMQQDHGQFDDVSEAFFPSGCASIFRAEMLHQIGFFDEDFFLYGDDTELGIRARLAGWECAFVPPAVAYHRGSASSSYYHPSKFYFVERNRLWVAVKYFPLELILLNPFFSLARYLFHLLALIRGSGVAAEFAKSQPWWLLAGIWFDAQISAWKALPHLWKKRRELLRKHHWSRKHFYRCFLPHRIGLRELTFTP